MSFYPSFLGAFQAPFGLQDWPTFKFDSTLATFTAGMAKRATSVFAASPIVQMSRNTDVGALTSDSFSISNGTAISGNFLPNFDFYQGSIVLWVIPEWNGNDGYSHTLFDATSSGVQLQKNTSNNLVLTVGGSGNTVSVSAASWVAGTVYCIVARWDCKNKIDGTNYACISINDTHTFGMTTVPSITSSSTSIIGAHSSGAFASNAIIQGFTIYRRVLYDGTYGVDVGNGDEINLIYASGSGADPTSITGSWDVVFCLPTNASTGALTTGTGEAWSHPHSSNVLKHGWLEDKYYGNPWAIKTTHSTFSSDSALDDLAANVFTIELWFNNSTGGYVLTKGNEWTIALDTNMVKMYVYTDGTNAYSYTSSLVNNDGKWHHVAVTYDNAGDRKVYIYYDGVIKSSYKQAATGTIKSDASSVISTGQADGYLTLNYYGWIRISNNIRYSADFVPSRTPPVVDANTIAQWNMNEGTGNTLDNAEGTASRDGALLGGTWEAQWVDEGSPVRPYSIIGSASYRADFGSGATVDDLHDGALTVDGWFRVPKTSSNQYLAYKGVPGTSGWWLRVGNGGALEGGIECATTDATLNASFSWGSSQWHYIKMTFDDAGDRKIRLYADDVLIGTSSSAGVGAVVSDAAVNGLIGHATLGNTGSHGWIRLSNIVRGAGMITREAPPAIDANTMAQWNITEGAGATLTDASGNANHGTMSGTYSWSAVPGAADMATDSPGARVFNWGYVAGSDAADEGYKQTLTGLTAGQDYVLRALAYSEDLISQPRVVIYDETNGAEISHIDGDWSRECVRNGGFDSDTLWTKGTGWTISGGVAHCDGSQTTVSSVYTDADPIVFRQYNWYKVVFTISNYVAGNVRPYVSDNGVGTYRSADGTYTEYIYCPGTVYSVYMSADADFVGDVDDFSVKRISTEQFPDNLLFSFELPTVARHGVAADCTSISVKLVNAATSGIVGWHQVELLTNLIDNPSLDTGAVADPWIPDGWTNESLDAGDSEQETTIKHSANGSIQANSGASAEGVYSSTFAPTSGKYYAVGGYLYNSTSSATTELLCYTSRYALQKSLTGFSVIPTVASLWKLVPAVIRAVSASSDNIYFRFSSSGPTARYVDDTYLFVLDDVSLTVTPASAANSVESSGIRIDGKDSLVQPVTQIGLSKGRIQFSYIPRHSAADILKFGFGAPGIATFYESDNNYIILEWTSANTMNIRYNAGGAGTQQQSWDATGAIVAGTTYIMQVDYTSSSMKLYVNGTLRATISAACVFSAILTNAYWGSGHTSSDQNDAVFLAP